MLRKRQLGKHDFYVSEIGFGCGGFWGLKLFDEKQAESLMRMAIESGVNFFDTGSNYSNGNAEARLGKILKGIDRSQLLVGTKAGTVMSSRGKAVKDFSAQSINRSVENSLRLLGFDCLPLLQLHYPSSDDLRDETLAALEGLKKRGLVRFIGASCDGEAAIRVVDCGSFDAIMTTYNLLSENSDTLQMAYNRGMGVFAMSPLARGVYSNNILRISSLSRIWYILRILKNYREDLRKGWHFRFLNTIPGWSGEEVALKYVLENRFITSAVIGTTQAHHLTQNVRVAQREPLGPEIMRKILEAKSKVFRNGHALSEPKPTP